MVTFTILPRGSKRACSSFGALCRVSSPAFQKLVEMHRSILQVLFLFLAFSYRSRFGSLLCVLMVACKTQIGLRSLCHALLVIRFALQHLNANIKLAVVF